MMRTHLPILTTFVGIAIVVIDLFGRDILDDAFTRIGPSGPQFWGPISLIDFGWLRLVGALIALVGAYFWISATSHNSRN